MSGGKEMLRRFGKIMVVVAFLFVNIVNVEAKERVVSHIELRDVTYSGENAIPRIKVFDQEGRHIPKKQYCMFFNGDTLNAGKVTVSVKGIRRVSGEASASYTIKKRNISSRQLSGIENHTYDGRKHDPNVRLTYHQYNVSYRLSYGDCKSIGKKKVKIVGIGNFTGTIYKNYKILPPSSRILTMTKSGTNVHLTLVKAAGGVKYQIGYKTKKKWKTKMVSGTHITINVKDKGKTSFKVRTCKNGVKSAWSAVKRV
jgi:hypothetical protein